MTREEKERIQQKLHRAADAHLNAYGGNLYYEGVARGLEQAAGIVGKTKCKEEPRWIPCSERLPDREGRYLVTLPLVNGYPWLRILHYGMPDFDEEYRRRCWYETGDYCDIAVNGIVAWMPLPEPYEEKEEKDGSD